MRLKNMVENKVDTEKLILEAARRVFIRKGLDGARMQEIADEAGINKALLHYYFRSKEKLFKMVFKEAMGKYFPVMVSVLSSNEFSFEKKLEAFIENYLSIIKENPFIPAFIIGELNKDPERLSEFFISSGIDTTHVSRIISDVIAKEAGISIQQARHLIVNVIALCVFPFLGRPLLEKIIFQSNEEQFNQFIQERKAIILEVVLNSISK